MFSGPIANWLVPIAIALTLTACVRPGDHPVNSDCAWIEEDSHPLNLENAADRRHLRFDAITAEDVAIRWADQRVAHLPEYERQRDECMEALFNGLASHHGVDVATVRQYWLQRDPFGDAAVILSFGVLYAIVANYLAGRIRRRFPPGEDGFWIMMLTMSVCVAVIGVAAGYLWSFVLEIYRLNDGHLSYRANRILWRQYWPVMFVGCFVVFWLVAMIRSRIGPRISRIS